MFLRNYYEDCMDEWNSSKNQYVIFLWYFYKRIPSWPWEQLHFIIIINVELFNSERERSREIDHYSGGTLKFVEFFFKTLIIILVEYNFEKDTLPNTKSSARLFNDLNLAFVQLQNLVSWPILNSPISKKLQN